MRQHVRSIVVSCLVAGLVTLPGPALASHDYDGMVPTANYDFICVNATPTTARVCQTDNANLYWYTDSANPGELEQDDLDAVRTMLLNEYVPTDLELIHDTTPVFEGDAQTDLVFQEAEADLPLPFPDIFGVTWWLIRPSRFTNVTGPTCALRRQTDTGYMAARSPAMRPGTPSVWYMVTMPIRSWTRATLDWAAW